MQTQGALMSLCWCLIDGWGYLTWNLGFSWNTFQERVFLLSYIFFFRLSLSYVTFFTPG